jgi:hypothetical protein
MPARAHLCSRPSHQGCAAVRRGLSARRLRRPVSVNMGSIVQKGLRLSSGQTHVKRYLEPLTKLIQEKKVDTTFLITHRSTDLAEGPDLYQTFKTKKDGCMKVVFPSRGMTFSGNHISLQASLDMKRSFPWLRKH